MNAAGDEDHETAREQERDLVDAGEIEGEHGQADRREQRALHRGPQESPDCLDDDGDDHGLDPVEEPGDLRQGAEPHVRPREPPDDQHRGHDEADAARDEPGPARARVAQVDRHLGGVRPRDEVRHPEEVEEALVGHPAPALDDLLAEEGDMRGGAPERDAAELEEEPDDLAQGTGIHVRPRVRYPPDPVKRPGALRAKDAV